jgi:Outer membrane protein
MAEVLREVLPAYYRNAIGFAVGVDRIISPVWQVRLGLSGEVAQERRISTSIWQDYRLLGVPASVLMNKANSDVDPTKGYRVELDVTPYVDFGPNNDFFCQDPADRPQLFRSRRARPQRAGAARSFGTEPTERRRHPPDKLFYAGGGGSVRGFVYQSAAARRLQQSRWAAPAWSRRTSNSASASASRSAPWPSSTPAAPIPTSCPTSRCSHPGSAPAWARATTPISGRYGWMWASRSTREGDPPFGIYVSLGQAF